MAVFPCFGAEYVTLFFIEVSPSKIMFITTLDAGVNSMTIALATLVPTCAVLLLIVTTFIAIVCVRKWRRKRRNVVVGSMDRVELKAINPQTEAGLVMVYKYIKNII